MPGKDNIYLTGFMGAGKSTIGGLLAGKLQRPFFDTDSLIEERCGKSIADIFEESGETFFRQMEKQIVTEVANQIGQIIALGGGSAIDEHSRRMITQSGITFYLQWPFRMLYERILAGRNRPLLNRLPSESALRQLYEQRRPYYEKADHVVACDACGTPQNIVSAIMKRLAGEL